MLSTEEKAKSAKQASYRLASMQAHTKNEALYRIARRIEKYQAKIFEANQIDLRQAESIGLPKASYNRLAITTSKLKAMIKNIRQVSLLEDPIGRLWFEKELDHGLVLQKISVPIGVVGVIFESRPDVLVQTASLCVKSSNASLLKGGKEAHQTNRVLFEIITKALCDTDQAFIHALQWIENRPEVHQLLSLNQYIDLIIPRGSRELVSEIMNNTKIPVLGHAEGICHLYIDKHADLQMAIEIFIDSKCQYPAACNAIETLLVHRDVADRFLPLLQNKTNNIHWIGDEKTALIVPVTPATQQDWSCEYSDLTISIKLVDSLHEAIDHINRYSSHHTDAIVTNHAKRAESFLRRVDSSSTMWNCSTRFADGFRYGFGAEMGISTNKIHARGPVGLEGLISYQYLLSGQGHIVADYINGRKNFLHETQHG